MQGTLTCLQCLAFSTNTKSFLEWSNINNIFVYNIFANLFLNKYNKLKNFCQRPGVDKIGLLRHNTYSALFAKQKHNQVIFKNTMLLSCNCKHNL